MDNLSSILKKSLKGTPHRTNPEAHAGNFHDYHALVGLKPLQIFFQELSFKKNYKLEPVKPVLFVSTSPTGRASKHSGANFQIVFSALTFFFFNCYFTFYC